MLFRLDAPPGKNCVGPLDNLTRRYTGWVQGIMVVILRHEYEKIDWNDEENSRLTEYERNVKFFTQR